MSLMLPLSTSIYGSTRVKPQLAETVGNHITTSPTDGCEG